MEYGSYECQYRMGLALLALDFGIIDPTWAIELLEDLKDKFGVVDNLEIDNLISLGKRILNRKLEN